MSLKPGIEKDDAVAIAEDGPVLEQTNKSFWERRIPVIACGAGLFSDGYLNGIIGSVSTILATIYGDRYTKTPAQANISSISFVGQVVGIAIFGWTSDHWSRKWSLFISTCIVFLFAILATASYGAGGSLGGLIAALAAYRFLIGIGIGGEYPAGSVGCAESTGELKSGTRNRWFIWFTNNLIDFGFVVAAIVSTIVVRITGDNHLRAAWRICLGIGIIPPLSLIWMRYKLDEPEAFKRETMARTRTPWKLVIRLYWFRLMIVSIIWFIYDFSAYAFNIYFTYITNLLISKQDPLWVTFAWSILLNFFYMPGAIAGSFISDWIGPRKTLAYGVFAQGIVGFIMAAVIKYLYQPQNVAAFVVVYGVFLALGEVGPGDNIGLCSAKTCATPVRGQYYAVAAAWGKIGAYTGIWAFKYLGQAGKTPIEQAQYPFWLASSLAIISAALAYFCLPEINQDTIDHEDRRLRAYLLDQGYDTSKMGLENYTTPNVYEDGGVHTQER